MRLTTLYSTWYIICVDDIILTGDNIMELDNSLLCALVCLFRTFLIQFQLIKKGKKRIGEIKGVFVKELG